MEINMGINMGICISTQQSMRKINKEQIINKFIEKFPKVLETVIKINKYCDSVNLNFDDENYFKELEQFDRIFNLVMINSSY